MTLPPSASHEDIISVLVRRIDRYVERWALGRVHTARAVIRALDSEVEPDIMVRTIAERTEDWAKRPVPIFIVEVTSRSTRRRDGGKKRKYYLDLGVPDYCIVDRESRTIQTVRPGIRDVVEHETATWHPAGAEEPLAIDVEALFREALGGR